MMRFCSLGSGSGGNATLVEARSGGTTSRVLVDCGFSLRELEARLLRADVEVSSLDAVFITHEHGDHVGCALTLARRHRVPVWASRGTWRAIGVPEGLGEGLVRLARDGDAIAIGNLELRPYTVPHDAGEPLQLCFGDGASKLGVLTDVGMSTPHLVAQLQQCDAMLLECNHDSGLLANSRYPASLKARIAGPLGHLANQVSADILAACVHGGLRHVVAAHLSEQNNSPALARAALAEAVGGTPDDIVVADPALGFPWLSLR
jgi:phosphoribosyl 1,2-cyclic phosphodiesterase